MISSTTTRDATHDDGPPELAARKKAQPGVVVLLDVGRPGALAFRVPTAGLEIGRGVPQGLFAKDDRVSRRHVRISQCAGTFRVTDLDSRNGTYVDGQLAPCGSAEAVRLVRIGRSLLWLVADVRPFMRRGPCFETSNVVLGGRTRQVWEEIASLSGAVDTLYIRGESGSGKELAARAFHKARFDAKPKAPFVGVNCAAIPQGLAERLLFGARRGAFSGATHDAQGYLQAADGGTLFLDEIAELDSLVQAKLLRVLEEREVLALGATQPQKVQIAVCCASFKSLRDEAAAGRFRQDLYYRLGRPEVQLPPLRERLDEIPTLLARELRAVDEALSASPAFVEACALRHWPGNVRELLGEVRRAALLALREGAERVETSHLDCHAGNPLAPDNVEIDVRGRVRSPEEIAATLHEHDGNVSGAARTLGMHRNQLRRWLAKQSASNPHVLNKRAAS